LNRFSFAAGTTDGPGDFDFVQGTNSSKTNPYWNWLAKFLFNPPKEQVKISSLFLSSPLSLFHSFICFLMKNKHLW
jgi:hypothetical protein